MTSREPVHGVGDAPPIDSFSKEVYPTNHGAKKVRSALRTIRDNYDQINHDDEREAIEHALKTIDECMNRDFKQAVDAVYPNSRASHALNNGSLVGVAVEEQTYSIDHRVIEIRMEVMMPSEK